MSVSTTPDASYKEMANHCEALLMGKQQKMSYLENNHHKQGHLLTLSSFQSSDEVNKQMVLHDIGLPKVKLHLSTNLIYITTHS